MAKTPQFKYRDSKTRWLQGYADGVKGRPFRYGKRRKQLAKNIPGLSTSGVLYWADYQSGYHCGKTYRASMNKPPATFLNCTVCWCLIAFIFVGLLLISLLE